MLIFKGEKSTYENFRTKKDYTFFKVLFCVEGLLKILDFGYFVRQKSDKKQEILKQSCNDLFILAELPIVWRIIRSDNIFNIIISSQWGICN